MNCRVLISTIAVLASAAVVNAGDLTPPGGPVQATDRVVLNEQTVTLPYTISQAGSYVLTSNLKGSGTGHGIIIESSDVTLDLNGFSLIGTQGDISGISVTLIGMDPLTNITIKNGVIRDWPQDGIDAGMGAASQSSFMDLSISGGLGGLRSGASSRILRVHVSGFESFGIHAGAKSHIESCTANANTGTQQFPPAGSATGFTSGIGCVFVSCTASRNGEYGFNVFQSTLEHCTAMENGSYGIFANSSILRDCTSESNWDNGFRVGNQSLILNCRAMGNSVHGFSIVAGVRVEGCAADSNQLSGIFVESTPAAGDCQVVSNTLRSNGVAGIEIGDLSDRNLIEGNLLIRNGTGILANNGLGTAPAGNTIISNRASGNISANYNILFLNTFGPLVGLTGGDMSALPDPNNSHPFANFAY